MEGGGNLLHRFQVSMFRAMAIKEPSARGLRRSPRPRTARPKAENELSARRLAPGGFSYRGTNPAGPDESPGLVIRRSSFLPGFRSFR